MTNMNLGKALNAATWISGTIVSASALAQSQGGSGSGMMGGYGFGWMGGYGGIGWAILIAAIVGGIVVWIGTQKRK